ncbi:PAS domain-containing protein [Thiomicrorhabdus sediminis]|uniref:PAS domain-containing protein n=1 Tax=Thiomicrorhabdus sediminis TaxID=2580412 RepID=A0A4P9K474_9GAMM|nr:PAS domain-containing protein [Thiomicrorhabdus sediminis]QCU89491.1 PAS domain-containing protein [Thiomicrorhabdus sediminis]
MRDNGAVTQKEYTLSSDITIVSRTDLHGNITEANEAFIEASGYDWKDLVGQPHNILRHPDVPAAVFQDFWQTIQNGKPWSQIVKNRRKNGDHYWVEANATPIFEKGEMVGYMSVRTAASREQIAAAEQAYKQISAGKLTLKEGIPVYAKDRFNPLLKFDQSTIITTLATLLLVLEFTPEIITGFTEIIPLLAIEILEVTLVALLIFTSFLSKKQLNKMAETITSISSGRFTNQIDTRGENTIAKTNGRLKSMQIKLGADIDDVKAALSHSKRIESALKSASSNVMVADRFRSIIFRTIRLLPCLKALKQNYRRACRTSIAIT